MGGHRNKHDGWKPPEGPFSCYFMCGNQLRTKFDRHEIKDWEWFTGYGESPVHFCPRCRKVKKEAIDRIREKLNVKPEGYPDVRAKI